MVQVRGVRIDPNAIGDGLHERSAIAAPGVPHRHIKHSELLVCSGARSEFAANLFVPTDAQAQASEKEGREREERAGGAYSSGKRSCFGPGK